jgi:flagellar motor switch protein FliN/FliY
LQDLSLPVSIELGRTNMLIRDIQKLGRGSVIEFDKLVSEPVDLIVNGKKIAEGEVVVIDKHFGIRITQIVTSNLRR